MFTIAKDFSFCFGHRVWSQKLEDGFATSLACKCRHLHGHEAKVVVHMSAPSLIRGMVTDFNNLGWFKSFLDDNLDHKFIMDRNDPLFETMSCGVAQRPIQVGGEDSPVVGHVFNCTDQGLEDAQFEYLESFFIVDFVPTSENFSKWIFDIVQSKMMNLGVLIEAIEWWESPKSRSVYSRSDLCE